MSDFFVKYQDGLPVVRANLSDDNGYIDLSTASSVYFIFQLKHRSVAPTTGSATVLASSSGFVEYSWATGSPPSGGTYYAEWRANFSNGRSLTIPNDGYVIFHINNRLF
jgi:hypothetical protein